MSRSEVPFDLVCICAYSREEYEILKKKENQLQRNYKLDCKKPIDKDAPTDPPEELSSRMVVNHKFNEIYNGRTNSTVPGSDIPSDDYKQELKKLSSKEKEMFNTSLQSWIEKPKSYNLDSFPRIDKNNYVLSLISIPYSVNNGVTLQQVEAVVNAANSTCRGGDGVDGAIHSDAGPGLLAECSTFKGCDTGHARITKGYNLPAKAVIHAVGPIFSKKKPAESEPEKYKILKQTVWDSLVLAKRWGIRSIAFPIISGSLYRGNEPLFKIIDAIVDTIVLYLEKAVCSTYMLNRPTTVAAVVPPQLKMGEGGGTSVTDRALYSDGSGWVPNSHIGLNRSTVNDRGRSVGYVWDESSTIAFDRSNVDGEADADTQERQDEDDTEPVASYRDIDGVRRKRKQTYEPIETVPRSYIYQETIIPNPFSPSNDVYREIIQKFKKSSSSPVKKKRITKK